MTNKNDKNCAITEHSAVPRTKEGACISQMIYVGTSPAFYDDNVGKSVNVKPLKLGSMTVYVHTKTDIVTFECNKVMSSTLYSVTRGTCCD